MAPKNLEQSKARGSAGVEGAKKAETEGGLSPLESAETTVDAYGAMDLSELGDRQREEIIADVEKSLNTFEDTMLEYSEDSTAEEKKRLLEGMEKALVMLERDANAKKNAGDGQAIRRWADFRDKLKRVGPDLTL